MSIPYSKLTPLLGQAAAVARRTGNPQFIVSRRGVFGSKFCVVDKPRAGDTVHVADIADPGVSDEALAALHRSLGSQPIETQKAILGFARTLRGGDATPFEADELAVIVWHMACGLSRFDFAHMRPLPKIA
ncbi:hypothetical protein [EBPR siphovirus 5]|nr:hypothetical protein [EBPR siphovirus 5]